MSIRIACPSCQKVYHFRDTTQGKVLRCRECQSAIHVPALADQGRRDDGSGSSDDRIPSSTRPASAVRRARRDEEDESRPHSTRRWSRREGEETGGGQLLWPILLGVGLLGPVLTGLLIAGVAVMKSGKGGSSTPALGAGGASLEGDLAAMKGTWLSEPVTTDDGKPLGTVKLSISPTAATEGQIRLAIARKHADRSLSSGSGQPFSLLQDDSHRVLATPPDYKRRRAIVFLYRFEGNQLVLTGKFTAGSFTCPLKDVALRQISTDPE